MEIKLMKLEDLKPADYNPRIDLQPGDPEYEKIKRSIEVHGCVEPLIWNKRTETLVGGHQRLKVLKDLGYTEIECVVVDLPENAEKALNVSLNKVGGDWDKTKLITLLKDLEDEGYDVTLTGYDLEETKALFGSGSMENVEEDDFDAEKEVQKIQAPITEQGDIWILGKHRLICGDSTNVEYYKLLTENQAVDLVVTDPPYNIDYGGTIAGEGRDIANDNLPDEEFYNFLLAFYKASAEVMKKGAPIYVFHSTKETVNFIKAMEEASLKYAQTLVWYKNHFTLGRQDYQWIHEPILYGWKEGAGHYFIDDRTLSTVFDDYKESGKKYSKQELVDLLDKILGMPTTVILDNKPIKNEDHPTMKPITLCAKLIYNSSYEGDTVLDPFGGSGSTLIAAEQLNRKARLIELDERYCDVIVRRYIQNVGNSDEVILVRHGVKSPYSEIAKES